MFRGEGNGENGGSGDKGEGGCERGGEVQVEGEGREVNKPIRRAMSSRKSAILFSKAGLVAGPGPELEVARYCVKMVSGQPCGTGVWELRGWSTALQHSASVLSWYLMTFCSALFSLLQLVMLFDKASRISLYNIEKAFLELVGFWMRHSSTKEQNSRKSEMGNSWVPLAPFTSIITARSRSSSNEQLLNL